MCLLKCCVIFIELTGINKNMVGTATGGSILGISPGTIGTSLVGGSIVGITPGM